MENNPIDPQTNTEKSLPETTPVPPMDTAPSPIDEAVTTPQPETPRTPVRTYETDLEQALEGREGGVIKLAIEDEARKDEERKNLTLLSQKNILYGIAAIVFVGLAVVAIISVKIYTRTNPTVGVGAQRLALVTFDTQKEITLDGKIPEQIIRELENTVKSVTTGNDTITYLVPTVKSLGMKKAASPKELFKKIEALFPVQLADALDTEYFYGVYTDKIGKNNAFLIFKSLEDEYALPGLATWESTLYQDVYQIFGVTPDDQTRTLLEKPLEDTIISNKNARVLLDKDEQPVLVTMFLNDGYVLIARDIPTILEITNRLYAKKVEK